MNAPITVVTQSVSTDINPRANTWIYITEVLQRAGLFFDKVSPDDLSSLVGRSNPIVVLAGDLRLTTEQRDALTTLVHNGGSIIAIGAHRGWMTFSAWVAKDL